MSNMLKEPMIMRQIIMDHYQFPRNHELVTTDGYIQRHMASDSCIDDITVQAKVNNSVIEEINFDGVACTISTASTSIMSELLHGKDVQEAKQIMNAYFAMIDGGEYDEDLLEEAIVFCSVGKQANRIKCATIGWNAMKEIIQEVEDANGK